MGGPPVKTYDMPESFKPEKADTGDALYRRSLYTFWRRTGPGPMLESFDVPKRVVCVAKRDTTNTPLHAFVLMNGPQFVEAARVLAERLLAEYDGRGRAVRSTGPSACSRAGQPDDEEKQILRRMHAAQREWYAARPDDAAKFVAIGDRKRDESLPAVDVAALAERGQRPDELRRKRGEAMNRSPIDRRELLGSFGMGFGGLALAEMLGRSAAAADGPAACSAASIIRRRRSG